MYKVATVLGWSEGRHRRREWYKVVPVVNQIIAGHQRVWEWYRD